jgi:hypothetical protein
LARAGHLVIRLNWPGLGDSALNADDPALVARQLSAVRAAIASLRGRGLERVAGIGVRAGGLLALAAGGFDGLVLWGVPATGRRYLREERAFHRLAARAYGDPPDDRLVLPSGAFEAGGFVYSAQTVAALAGVVPQELSADVLPPRALLIGRDGTPPPSALVEGLRKGGVQVTVSAARGLGDLLENAYQATISLEVTAAVLEWLPGDEGREQIGAAAGAARIELSGGVRERPWVQQGGSGELSGIVCEPAGGAAPGASWTLFFNAGGIRRCGPNRLWTLAARALARSGTPSLRLDVRDVGDSDGTSEPHTDLDEMYAESSIDDAVLATDWVLAQGAGAVDVVGLCSGSFLGLQVSARRQVRRALLFNGLAFVWDEDARVSTMTSHIWASLLDRRRWSRLLTGRIDASALVRSIVRKVRLQASEVVARAKGRPPASVVALLFRRVALRGTVVHLVSSEGDPSIAYLERQVPAAERPRLTILSGVDHTIRPVWAHPRVVELIQASAAEG